MKESGQTGAHRRKAAGGFTVIELMITIVILGILVMLAGPSFRDAIDRYRVKKTAEDLISSIYFARSEAMRIGGEVDVVPLGGNWSSGWQVIDRSTRTVLQESTVPYSMVIVAGGPALGNVTDSSNAVFGNGLPINRWGRNGQATFTVDVVPANPLAIRCIGSNAGGGIALGEYGGVCPP